ncbi:MAG: endonuclease III [Gemmatimonadetes bacterium]|nr:endonuclease III [Gemmatimonadota bacterium]
MKGTKPKAASAKGGRPSGAPSSSRGAKAGPITKVAARGATRGTAATRKPKRIAKDQLPAHAAEIYRRLVAEYPDAHCELDFRTPFELLAATILSAQCTDKRVNMTTPALFAKYPDAAALAVAKQEDVEAIIKSTGFFRAKAKNLIAMAGDLVDQLGGQVPADMDALVKLAGVGRKTANVLLGNAFNINVGVVVDTHVARLAARLGLTAETDPIKIEQALMPLFPRDSWTMLSHLLIWHGRRTCDAKKPRCAACTLADLCPSAA